MLFFEEKSELKHEYINGTLFEISGASKYHNKLRRKIANLLTGIPLIADASTYLYNC
jgi:hypothetical protein